MTPAHIGIAAGVASWVIGIGEAVGIGGALDDGEVTKDDILPIVVVSLATNIGIGYLVYRLAKS